jgi:hypothetical protein
VNNTTAIRALVPTYFYASVRYTDGLEGQAARESYTGITLRIEYNGGVRTAPGPKPEQAMVFFSGEFGQDYTDVVDFVQTLNVDDAPFMVSSSFDDYLFDAGYDGLEDAADEAAQAEAVPFASAAQLAADAFLTPEEQAARIAFDAALAADLPFSPTTEIDRALAVSKSLERAWSEVPAAKLQWALANVIASSAGAMDALKVLDGLLAEAKVLDGLRRS